MRRWESLWSSPAATMWHGSDAWIVLRLLQVEQLWRETGKVTLLGEVRLLEMSLGVGPRARRELRWRVVDRDAELVDAATVDERREWLRVADRQAGSES
jgi:hypothetical protein